MKGNQRDDLQRGGKNENLQDLSFTDLANADKELKNDTDKRS